MRGDDVAKCGKLRGIDVAHQNMSVVHAADFVVVNILGAQLSDKAVNGLVRFLGNGFLHLHLKNQVRAALEVQAQPDLVAEIIFYVL